MINKNEKSGRASLKKSVTPLSSKDLDTVVGGMRAARPFDMDGPEVKRD